VNFALEFCYFISIIQLKRKNKIGEEGMSIKNKLNRLKPHLSASGNQQKQNSPNVVYMPKEEEIPFMDVWRREGVTPYFADESYCLVREVTYPLNYQHGKYRFSDFLKAIMAWNETNFNHPLSAAGHRPDELFFFDTETTGLGGGVGNTIFLLGYASFNETSVIVKQHILPQPGSEVPLYKSFLENVNYEKMVTYNGKAFDWPQVKTRHTLIREHVPKLPGFGHFDLYHASRRIWKHRLERMKLSIVEKEILKFTRQDDVPGFLAPMIYFDFIESKNPEGMLGIMRHNELDVLSLITLYTHLTFQLLQLDQSQTDMETFEVGRWYSYLGENETAKDVFLGLRDAREEISLKAKHELAYQFKKKKEWYSALELWEEVADNDFTPLQTEACIELAKIFEHRVKNLEKAIFYTNKAIANVGEGNSMEFLKRMKRLQEKSRKL
jgi:uncharacterized protein